MNTLDELKYYINDRNPVGATMLTGKQSKDYIVDDIIDIMKERGIIMGQGVAPYCLTLTQLLAQCQKKPLKKNQRQFFTPGRVI